MDLEEVYDKIYRYAYFKLNNQSVAEDVTQETFLRFISQKGNVHEYEIKYLYVIARNLCIDEYRRVKADPLPEDYDAPAPFDDRREERMMVREALAKLPREDQEILLLRHVNGEAVGTICKALGISRFAAYRRLKSAEDKMRESLEVNEG
jgi:RNA polymerase sigma-70 factor (ECF subfamily)